MAERMKMSEAVDRIGELAKETMLLENLLQALKDDYFEGVAESLTGLARVWVTKQHQNRIMEPIKQAVGKGIEMNYDEVADVLRAAGWTEPPVTIVEAEKEAPF